MAKRTWFPAVCAVGGIACIWQLLNGSVEAGRMFIWLPLLAAFWAAGHRFWQENDRQLQALFGTLGALFAAAFVLNLRLHYIGYTGWYALGLCVMAGFLLGAPIGEGFIWLYRKLDSLKKPIGLNERKAFWLSLGVLLLCWLPVLVAYFPGITGYDMDFQTYQIYENEYSAHHPLLHTLFIKLFMELGNWLWQSYTLGYGLHTVAQYLLLALSMAYALRWLSRICASRTLWLGTLMFFALSPQHMVMASSGTKDVLFAAAMLVLMVELLRFVTEKGRKTKPSAWAINILLIACACMLRNNTIYGLALLILLGTTFWRRKMGKRVLAMLSAGIIAGCAGLSGLKLVTKATDVSVREMLCIPCQQLARVYDLYELTRPVGYEIREVMPFVEDYSPERVDHVKRQARVTTPERLWRFVKLWVREAFHYPIEYIDAALFLTKPYWAVDDISFATTYSGAGCMILSHNPNTKVDALGLWPQVKETCDKLFMENDYQQFPILWTLMHPAFYTWFLGFVLAWAAYRRRKAELICAGVLTVYLLTLLLGPVSLIRYSYYLMLCLPVLLSTLVCQRGEIENE